jgi:Cu(I)/Ag(I) efflux system membrane fusion protein
MLLDVDLRVELPDTLALPVDAVLDSGQRKVVFVDRGAGHYEPRAVDTGWRSDGLVEILRGLDPGERVVVSGQFLLDSESRLRSAAAPPPQAAPPPATDGNARVVDPACGMRIDPAHAFATRERDGILYHFCSASCAARFDADPAGCIARHGAPSMAAGGRGR